jgi:hemerythrin
MITEEALRHYEMGIPVMDKEHRTLIEVLYRADEYVKQGNSGQILVTLIEFSKLLEEHFKSEEALLVHIDYSFLESHEESHRAILREVKKMCDTLAKHPSNYKQIAIDLEKILTGHFDEEDRQYIKPFKKYQEEKNSKTN